MGKIITLVNQKGGVGKTTTATNLATALASLGKKTLLIDSDPQGNASTGFGFDKEKNKHNLYTLLIGECDLSTSIKPTLVTGLDIIMGDISLAGLELEMANTAGYQYIVKRKLSEIIDKYDYILIDCPPSLGILTINALVASSSIIIPLQCEFFALEGLKHLMEIFKLVKYNLNKDLAINGILLTMHDKRTNLTELIEKDVRGCLGKLIYTTTIPRNVRLSEAPSHGKPGLIYDLHCPGSVAYIAMAKEFLEREKTEHKLVV